MSYTHLQIHSGYSLLDSTITIDQLVKRASELKFDSIALTDHEVLYGVIPFYKSCVEYGIKPIIGMTIQLLNMNNEHEQCILLAKNNDGYQQLIKMSTLINRDNEILELNKLHSYAKNLICILPIHSSSLAKLFIDESFKEAREEIKVWLDVFTEKDFYLGVQDHGLASERILHMKIKTFHQQHHVNAVAINDVRYLYETDYVAFDCLQAIKLNRRWSTANIDADIKNKHLRSAKEMKGIFNDFWPELLQNTELIKNKCNVSLEFNQSLMPSYPTPNHLSAHTYLENLCWKNVKDKYEEITKEISDRLTYELEVIQSMDFSDYFLIVWDFITFARKNEIIVGPGRGSAAGSIVAYVLGITQVDPLEYGLLFERFLNPERISMPDIDIDFADHRRDEVIDYVRSKYGEEYVAQIITFGTFGARSLLRELFKTMGIAQQDIYYIFNIIPSHANLPIIDYINQSNDLKEYIKQSKKLRVLFKVATTLEGLPRHISTHAAGIVMSKDPLINYVPLTKGTGETSLTQFPMDDLESIGLLKMDFLGLRNLTFIDQISQSISYETNQKFSINNIPLDDQKTFQLLQTGQTNGIFQLESQGMKQVLKNLKPNNFEDIVAVNALYRPGPMDYIQTYIDRKRKKEKVSYPHPDLKPILEKTYGVLIYQEQIMQIAHKIAGFSLGEADVLRRAISKKDPNLLARKKESFIQGCLNNGYEEKIANKIFLWIKRFSNYGFNRSHAVAYSKISYQLAFLKANYPTYFFAELLSSVHHQKEKIYQYMKEVRHLKITVLPPSINKSFGKYSVENNSIRMGLLAIKGIGYQIVKEIIEARKNGPFKSLFDFCLRVSSKVINRKTLELLILSGAFDEIYKNRASLLASIDQAIEQGELFGGFHHQPSLLSDKLGMHENYTKIEDFTQMKKLHDEKDLLGIYISSHPLKEYRGKLECNGYLPLLNARHLIGKRNVKSAAVIQAIKKIRTKRGDPMAFIVIGDETADMEAVIFPELYRNENSWLKEEELVFINGKIEERNRSVQWILSSIKPFNEKKLQRTNNRLFIKLINHEPDEVLSFIRKTAMKYPGNTPIFIYHQKSKKTYKLAHQYNIHPNSECLNELGQHFGKESVVLDKKS